jgi:hypothetical protein
MAVIQGNTSPFGLGGGTYLTGSATISGNGGYFFVYYPIQDSTATITFTNMVSGSTITGTFSAGIPLYGQISSITQSSGAAFAYNAITDINDL